MQMTDISFSGIKESLQSLLNSHPISTDSLEGWVLIFLIAFIGWNLYKKALKFVGWSCAVILLIQTWIFSQSDTVNNFIPLSSIFKFDILTAIAQTCVGTPLCDGILSINAAIQYICLNAWDTIHNFSIGGLFTR